MLEKSSNPKRNIKKYIFVRLDLNNSIEINIITEKLKRNIASDLINQIITKISKADKLILAKAIIKKKDDKLKALKSKIEFMPNTDKSN